MRANRFLSKRKKPICTAKMIKEVERAVKKATMLIPTEFWPTPLPAAAADVDEVAAALPVVDDVVFDMAPRWDYEAQRSSSPRRDGPVAGCCCGPPVL